MASIHYIRQRDPLGLGHAVSVAEEHVGSEPFAVLLGDDIMAETNPLLQEMLRVHERYGRSVIAARRSAATRSRLYGCIEPEFVENEHLARVQSIVEKPSPEDAPSNLAAIGRYVLTPEIFDALREPRAGSWAARCSSPMRSTHSPRNRPCTPTCSRAAGSTSGTSSTTSRRRWSSPWTARTSVRDLRRWLADFAERKKLLLDQRRRYDWAAMATHAHVARPRQWRRAHPRRGGARARSCRRSTRSSRSKLPLTEAYGCVLAADVVAGHDIPDVRFLGDGRVRRARPRTSAGRPVRPGGAPRSSVAR